jgi:hypothetical protein
MMKKLTLNLDALTVEQFETTGTGMGTDAFMTGPENCVTITCGDSVRVACEI